MPEAHPAGRRELPAPLAIPELSLSPSSGRLAGEPRIPAWEVTSALPSVMEGLGGVAGEQRQSAVGPHQGGSQGQMLKSSPRGWGGAATLDWKSSPFPTCWSTRPSCGPEPVPSSPPPYPEAWTHRAEMDYYADTLVRPLQRSRRRRRATPRVPLRREPEHSLSQTTSYNMKTLGVLSFFLFPFQVDPYPLGVSCPKPGLPRAPPGLQRWDAPGLPHLLASAGLRLGAPYNTSRGPSLPLLPTVASEASDSGWGPRMSAFPYPPLDPLKPSRSSLLPHGLATPLCGLTSPPAPEAASRGSGCSAHLETCREAVSGARAGKKAAPPNLNPGSHSSASRTG